MGISCPLSLAFGRTGVGRLKASVGVELRLLPAPRLGRKIKIPPALNVRFSAQLGCCVSGDEGELRHVENCRLLTACGRLRPPPRPGRKVWVGWSEKGDVRGGVGTGSGSLRAPGSAALDAGERRVREEAAT